MARVRGQGPGPRPGLQRLAPGGARAEPAARTLLKMCGASGMTGVNVSPSACAGAVETTARARTRCSPWLGLGLGLGLGLVANPNPNPCS